MKISLLIFGLMLSGFARWSHGIDLVSPEILALSSQETAPGEPPMASAAGFVQDSRELTDVASMRSEKSTSTESFQRSLLPAQSFYDYVPEENCLGQMPGTYGDPTDGCESFTVCQSDGRLSRSRCPEYTKFNNYLGLCDWHFRVDLDCNSNGRNSYPEHPSHSTSSPEAPSRSQIQRPLVHSSVEADRRLYSSEERPPGEQAVQDLPLQIEILEPQKIHGAGGPSRVLQRLLYYYATRKPRRKPSDSSEFLTGYDQIYFPNLGSPYIPNYVAKKYDVSDSV